MYNDNPSSGQSFRSNPLGKIPSIHFQGKHCISLDAPQGYGSTKYVNCGPFPSSHGLLNFPDLSLHFVLICTYHSVGGLRIHWSRVLTPCCNFDTAQQHNDLHSY